MDKIKKIQKMCRKKFRPSIITNIKCNNCKYCRDEYYYVHNIYNEPAHECELFEIKKNKKIYPFNIEWIGKGYLIYLINNK